MVQAELNPSHFLSNSGSKVMVGNEDIEQEEMETIGSRVKGIVLKEGKNISMDIASYYMHYSMN